MDSDLHVGRLSSTDVHSLAAALFAAAVVATPTPECGAVSIPAAANRPFSVPDVLAVVREWTAAAAGRHPAVGLAPTRFRRL